MDRDSFIRVLEVCINSATGRRYPNIEWAAMSNQGLIECAELVRDLLEHRVRAETGFREAPMTRDGKVH